MSTFSEPVRRPLRIPTLRKGDLHPEEYAHTTCFEAGYLVVKNAGWRNVRPVVDRATCTGCLQCYLHCPDGTVYKVEASAGEGSAAKPGAQLVAIDYDFCKGCGICAKICAFGAIAMVSEQEALAEEAALAAEGATDGDATSGCPATDSESEADAR